MLCSAEYLHPRCLQACIFRNGAGLKAFQVLTPTSR